jgi:ATP-dependent exoDNAse (exonuclease V) beta subunit
MVLAPHPTKAKNAKKTVAALLYQGIKQSTLSEHWKEISQEYSVGAAIARGDDSPEKSEAINLLNYPSFRWREKLVIRQTAKNYFNPQQIEKREKLNLGIHLHMLLSRIKYSYELQDVVNEMLFEGFLTPDEQKPFVEQIEDLLRLPQVSRWFSNEWEVRTELPILLPNGTENRIDRLMINGKKAVIVDFKTGDPLKSDQTQVLAYMDILKKMNFIDVEGYLLYIKTKQVVSVTREKIRVSRRKDENQFSLDF